MKFCYLILFIFFIKCSTHKDTAEKEGNTFYFYFDEDNTTMKKYYTGQNPSTGKNVGPLKFLYVLDNIDNVIFINKKNKAPKRIKISTKDTSKMNIKTIKWLNKMSPDRERRYDFFNKKNNTFHIIEKDTITGGLYLIKNMITINEIE